MRAPILSNQATPEEVGARYRTARDDAGLSRAQVAKLSNVSAKAIEKFEAGQQQPSLLRFAALCEAVGKSVEEILNGDVQDNDGEAAPAPRRATLPAPRQVQPFAQPVPEPETAADRARGLLMDLDELRETRFRNAQRRAMALVEQVVSELRFLEAEELIDLAHERGVFPAGLPAVHELEQLLIKEPAKGQEQCHALGLRVIDTALLGADVFAVDLKALGELAKRMQIDKPFFGWDDHPEIAAKLLEPLRAAAVAGQGEDLGNEKAFPNRS